MKKTFTSLFAMAAVLLMLSSFTADVECLRGDVDKSGEVNVADVSCLIDYLITGSWFDEPEDNREWVDLGLPSGTLWATCNVGADSPEEFGDYFAWGETEPKETYEWSNYKWCKGAKDRLTKYWDYSHSTYIDPTELEPGDDAATVNWGKWWRTPSWEEFNELCDNSICKWKWTQINGVNGMLVTGPNGNTLFLPAGSNQNGTNIPAAGEIGVLWTRTVYRYQTIYAGYLLFKSNGFGLSHMKRYIGCPVRPVRVSQE